MFLDRWPRDSIFRWQNFWLVMSGASASMDSLKAAPAGVWVDVEDDPPRVRIRQIRDDPSDEADLIAAPADPCFIQVLRARGRARDHNSYTIAVGSIPDSNTSDVHLVGRIPSLSHPRRLVRIPVRLLRPTIWLAEADVWLDNLRLQIGDAFVDSPRPRRGP